MDTNDKSLGARDLSGFTPLPPDADIMLSVDEILSEYHKEAVRPAVPSTEDELKQSIGDIVASVLVEDERRRSAVKKSRPAQKPDRPEPEQRQKQEKITYLDPKNRGGAKEIPSAAQSGPATGKKNRGKAVHTERLPRPLPNIAPEKMQKKAKAQANSARTRAFIACIFSAASVYLAIAPDLGFPAPVASISVPLQCGLLAAVLLICYDVAVRGAAAAIALRPTYESLADMLAALTLFDGLDAFISKAEPQFAPFCAIAAIALTAALVGSKDRFDAQAVALKSYLAVSQPITLGVQTDAYRGAGVIRRREDPAVGYAALLLQPDNLQRLMRYFAPLAAVGSFVLALTVGAAGKGDAAFIHVWSGILAVCAPFAYAISFTSPFKKVTRRLTRAGAALAGGDGARRLARGKYMLLTDRDVFPDGSVSLNGLKIYGGAILNKIAGYTSSIVAASASCLSKPFADLAREQFCPPYRVSDFSAHNGGMSALIEGNFVLCGDGEFMLRNHITLPDGVKLENKLFIAVNSELAGAFALTYAAAPSVSVSLSALISSGVSPLFAPSPFNFAPKTLASVFGLAEADIIMLTADEYSKLQKNGDFGPPAAVMNRGSLTSAEEAVTGSRRLVRTVRLNVFFAVLSAMLGLTIMSFLMFIGAYSSASACNAVVFMLCWLVPELFCSGGVVKF